MDAGFGYNNPCEVLIAEAQKQFPNHERMLVLSVGTGLGNVVSISDSRKSILKALKKMATSSKKVHLRLDERYGDGREYFRFNVERGLEDVTLSDWKKASNISSHTANYLEEKKRIIKAFVDTVIWENPIEADIPRSKKPRTSERKYWDNPSSDYEMSSS